MQNAGDEYACLWMCFVHVFVCAYLCMCMVVRLCLTYLKMCTQVCEHVCVCVCTSACVQIYRQTDRQREVSVKVCLSMMMEREGSLSFNIVLLGHWAICECTELTADAQFSLVHPPTSSAPTPLASLPLPAYPLWLTALVVWWNRGTNTDMVQDVCREPCLHQSLCWWWALNRIGRRGLTAPALACRHHIERYWYLHISYFYCMKDLSFNNPDLI